MKNYIKNTERGAKMEWITATQMSYDNRKLTLEELREGTADAPLDRDKDGRILFSSDIVNQIKETLAKRKNDKQMFELRWTLNANFLAGNQFCEINVHSSTIEQYGALVRLDGT